MRKSISRFFYLNFMKNLQQYLTPAIKLGLIGAGVFGSKIKDFALACGVRKENILLCDPPKCAEDAENLNDALHIEWGNGMGGCDFSRMETETYLPLSELTRADVICIQIPATPENAGAIGKEFLDRCKADVRIFCYSDPFVLAEDIRSDSRINNL